MKTKLSYKKVFPPMLDGWIYEIRYKGVYIELALGDKDEDGKPWASIYAMMSKNQGKGECQEALRLIKADYPKRVFYGSVPMNNVAKHIFDKHKIKYTYDEEVLKNSYDRSQT